MPASAHDEKLPELRDRREAWQADAGCFVEKSGRRQGPQKIIKVFVFVLEREEGGRRERKRES